MEINIKRNSIYNEMIITTNNTNYSTGLLDEKESIKLVKELIYAAEMLLPAHLDDHESKLAQIREDL